jgi:hypothetical protein
MNRTLDTVATICYSSLVNQGKEGTKMNNKAIRAAANGTLKSRLTALGKVADRTPEQATEVSRRSVPRTCSATS